MNDMNQARYNLVGAGADNTAGLAIGGTPGSVALTEEWNGVSWVETSDLNDGRDDMAGGGTVTSAIIFGGSPGGVVGTEEWNVPGTVTKTISTD